MPDIRFERVTKAYGGSGPDTPAAVHDVTLAIPEGDLVVLLGPSGCGKTTMLRMVNRLIEPTSGQIYIGEREIHEIPATDLRRHIGYVIQQTGLFPHYTVEQNVAVVPKLLGWPREKTQERVQELLELVDLPPDQFRGRYPRQLSGGQQQRVGIARAMAADPTVMLMDEPFGAIDAITRADLQNELKRIQAQVHKTIVFVTHDVEEALKLADRIAVMRTGQVVQYDTPLVLLSRPADEFVSSLLGARDILRRMSLIPVASIMEAPGENPSHVTVAPDANLRDVLSALVAAGAQEAAVRDGAGQAVGRVTLARLLADAAHPEQLATAGS
ncbi:MAG TPA: ABC transporter ATP-binding protein [Chloroflexota bacterium]|nr:ABC transporter ATP-binding protein [Chloroflexota bacterium]